MTDLSIVVVNYRGERLLGPCLASIERSASDSGLPTETIVVDNASDDGSAAIAERHAGVRLLRLPANRGFGAAVNAALRESRGRWVLVLNNDVTLEPQTVGRLFDATSDPAVGSIAAEMRFHDAPDVVNSAGIGVDALGVAFDRDVGERPSSASQPVEVFGASGGAALYRREMLEDVGGFDESFFLFLEDVDLAWRAQARGWRAVYVPGAVVLHHHSATAGHGSKEKLFLVGRNRVRLLARNATPAQLARSAPGIVLYDLAYVGYVAARARTLAPLRGRFAGIRGWRSDRRAGASWRRPVRLERRQGIAAALRRNRAFGRRHGESAR